MGVVGEVVVMSYYVQGDWIFFSGGVIYVDVVLLLVLLVKVQVEGCLICEVVLCIFNGGVLIVGEWLQGVICMVGLNIIVFGYCIFLCFIMQFGGVECYMVGDLLIVDLVQIYVVSSGGKVIYMLLVCMIEIYIGNYGGGMDVGLLCKVMYEVVQFNGLLVFFDLVCICGNLVSFDLDGFGVKCVIFVGEDMFNNNIMILVEYCVLGDMFNVIVNVFGDINVGYLCIGCQLQMFVDDDFVCWNIDWQFIYINLVQFIYNVFSCGFNGIGLDLVQDYFSDFGIQVLLLFKLCLNDFVVFIFDDLMGVICVINGVVWCIVVIIGVDFMLVDNGIIVLEGGVLCVVEVCVMQISMLVGYGDIVLLVMDFNVLVEGSGLLWCEDGFNCLCVYGILMLCGGDLVIYGYVNIMLGGKVLFDVIENGGVVNGCLCVGIFFDDEQIDGVLVILFGVYLELNVVCGYYDGSYCCDLVIGFIYQDGFQDVVCLGDIGYIVSIVEGEVFCLCYNLLLSFNVVQSVNGLLLIVNLGFDQFGLFVNVIFGDGLGCVFVSVVIGNVVGFKLLLVLLQFFDCDVIVQQVGGLCGDSYVILCLVDIVLVGSIGNVVQQYQFDMCSSGGDVDGLVVQVVQVVFVQLGMGNGSLFNQLVMYLVQLVGDIGSVGIVGDCCSVGMWGCGFGSQGCIDVNGGVVGLIYIIGGIVFGVDMCLVDDKVILGVSVVVVEMFIKGCDGIGFSGDVCVLDVGGYLDVVYLCGYLLVLLCYIDLCYDIYCSIVGIEGLEVLLCVKYDSDVLLVCLEYGFLFIMVCGLVVQLLLFVVDYVCLFNVCFNEGQGVGVLVGCSDSLESICVGVGLQLFKIFEGCKGECIILYVCVLWQKELGDIQVQFSIGFVVVLDLVFGLISQLVGEQVLSWNVGVISCVSECLLIMIDYVGECWDGQDQNGVMLGLGYCF